MRLLLLSLISLSFLLHSSEAVSQELNGGWTLINKNGSIEIHDITVPSGVYSDLENANVTESVLFSYNDVELRWIALENWTYSLQFDMTAEAINHKFVILTFNGLDTLAEVFLNGEPLGSTNNMFVRYHFNVKEILVNGTNELRVEFTSPVEGALHLHSKREHEIPPSCPPDVYNGECHMNLLRKMQASFAWDWGLAAPSMGIWKTAHVDVYDSVIIRHVTYKLSNGVVNDDTEEQDSDEDVWTLKIFVHMETGMESVELDGVLACELVEVKNTSSLHKIHIKTDKSGEFTQEIVMAVSKSAVKNWWPNGYGSQALYELLIRWEDVRVNEVAYREREFFVASKTINIGFRTVELIQEPMSNGYSFYFKVNGVPIFMKGSNWIPAHILPEKTENKAKVKELMQATRDANMNMLRVWGGGVYESNYFYSLADEYGIMIWQDMMFACAMYPAEKDFLDSVRLEVKMQVRRLQYHPSIAMFATNNENEVALAQNWYGTQSRFRYFAEEYYKLYVATVTDEIRRQDPMREVLTSSPSNGRFNGDRQYGISMDAQNPHYGDIHFYITDHNAWKTENFHQPRFSSEYGFQSFPAGWSSVLRDGDNLTELVDHRQHHPLRSKPIGFLVEENLNVNFDSLAWDDKIYLSQLSQAMAIKAETEVYRTGRGSFMNTMGALYWQLNDVWVAPSWSSIEYNGNFKILHHWVQQMFASQSIITQVNLLDQLQVYLISDQINVGTKAMTIKMNLYKWNGFRVVATTSWKCNMTENSAELVKEFDIFKYMDDNKYSIRDYMAYFQLIDDSDSRVVSANFVFPVSFKEVTSVGNPKPTVKIGTSSKCDKGSHTISLEVKIETPAFFMSIIFNHNSIKEYRLSKNGFIQLEPIQVVQVTFQNPGCQHVITADNFVVKTLNQFLL